jgi:hypothetical protein
VRIDPRAVLKLPLPTLLLGAVTLAIGVTIVMIAISGTRADDLLATRAQPPASLNVDVSSIARSADLGAMRSQPLLHASRSFYTPPARDAAPAAPPRPDYRLAGTFLVPRKPAVALLVGRANGASKRVKPGDELEGWRVEVVDRRLVTLSWGAERFDITATQTPVPMSAGLKRVPIQRQRVAASGGGGVQSLSATGTSSTSLGGTGADAPRLYRPPPN